MLSANIVKIKAMTPAMMEAASDPAMNQASAATTPPVATEPSSLPSVVRMIAPTTRSANSTNGLNGSKLLDEPELCRGAGAGNPSPSITRIMRSIPAETPPAKSPLLNLGVITSSMMRAAVASLSAPSSP